MAGLINSQTLIHGPHLSSFRRPSLQLTARIRLYLDPALAGFVWKCPNAWFVNNGYVPSRTPPIPPSFIILPVAFAVASALRLLAL
jgi:hypothetical protein